MLNGLRKDMAQGLLLSTNLFDPYKDPTQPGMSFLMGSVDEGYNVSGALLNGGNPFGSKIAVKAGSKSMGLLTTGFLAAGGAMALAPAVIGYKENGLTGAAQYMGTDIATQAALARFHFRPALALMAKNGAGRIAPGLMGGGGSGNTLRYIRGVGGGLIGGAIGGAVGGAVGGFVGGDFGRSIGSVGGTLAGAYGATALAVTPGGWIAGLGLGAVTLGAAATVGAAAGASYGTYATLRAGYRHRQMQKSIHTSGSLAAFNTQSAQTMRQRAVQAIHKSHLNARSALGQEANYMHFPSRNYNSQYRRFY